MSAERPRKVAGLAVRELPDGECVVLPPDGKAALVLNATGAAVLDLCDGERTTAAIAAILVGGFPDAPAAAVLDDVSELVTRLAQAGCFVP